MVIAVTPIEGVLWAGIFAGCLAVLAACLATACRLVGLEPLDFFHALVICFGISMVIGLIHIAFAAVMGMGAGVDVTSPARLRPYVVKAMPITLIVYPFVATAAYSVVIPNAGILKGFLIWLLQMVVLFAVSAVIGGGYYVIQKIPNEKGVSVLEEKGHGPDRDGDRVAGGPRPPVFSIPADF